MPAVWRQQTVSVVLPTYREKDSIYRVVQAFSETGVVDEILVINNNAEEGTSAEVARTAAREVFEPRQGYGYAIRRGFEEATSDYIVVCEPDGTFLASDIFKLLVFADDVDVVYGSRTIGVFIWRGANMGFMLRLGNWAVAKGMELLFNSVSLSDVGCTMRLIRRDALQTLRPEFTVGGSAFGAEMMLLSLTHHLRVIQIPVNYLPRVGRSSVTGDIRKAVLLGVRMVGMILKVRLIYWFRRGRRHSVPVATGGRPNSK